MHASGETWNFHPEFKFPLVKSSCLILHICTGIQYDIYCKVKFYDSETKAWARAQRWIRLDEFGVVCIFGVT